MSKRFKFTSGPAMMSARISGQTRSTAEIWDAGVPALELPIAVLRQNLLTSVLFTVCPNVVNACWHNCNEEVSKLSAMVVDGSGISKVCVKLDCLEIFWIAPCIWTSKPLTTMAVDAEIYTLHWKRVLLKNNLIHIGTQRKIRLKDFKYINNEYYLINN